MVHRPIVTLALTAVLAISAAACAVRSPSIADLRTDPGRYYDRTVSVEGTVTSAWNVPLVPLKVYRLGDGSGEITVVSEHGRVPPRGARVRVKGRVTEFGTFGGNSLGMHLRESSVKVLR